jgi:hypothetical protein
MALFVQYCPALSSVVQVKKKLVQFWKVCQCYCNNCPEVCYFLLK